MSNSAPAPVAPFLPPARSLALPDPTRRGTCCHHVMASPGTNSIVVITCGAVVRWFCNEHPAMRVSKATFLKLLQRDERTHGLTPEGLKIGTDVATQLEA